MKLTEEILALIKPAMKLEQCDFVGRCQSSPSEYAHDIGQYGTPSMMRIANHADQQLEAAWAKTNAVHAANAEAIANNQAIGDLLRAVMKVAGVKETYTVYERPPRARYSKNVTHHAGWPGDIIRTFPTSDGFESARSSYENLRRRYAEYRLHAEQEVKQKERAIEAEKEKRKADIELAKLIVRYGVEGDAPDFGDALEALRQKDQYLDLAVAGYETRCDWSEGFYRVEAALRRFRIRDERDKNIAADIAGCLGGEERDGRTFRDTEWSYEKLFSLVEDQQLVVDAKLCLERQVT